MTFITAIIILAGGAVTLAWMNTGFVECSGYLEPDSWLPLYAYSEGLVKKGSLEDGMTVIKGSRLILLDDEWPGWNIKRVIQEQKTIRCEITYMEQRLALFSIHRKIEESEYERLMDADRRLLENSSLTINELKHDEYLYHTFVAGADREQADLKHALLLKNSKFESLRAEKVLWESRLKDAQILAPVSGTYYCVETVLSGASAGLIPSIGPGRQIESGRLLGFIIPNGGMKAHIEIPQHRISGCSPGKLVLLSVDARPQWRFAPVRGRLASVTKIASGGVFHATVNLSVSEQILDELKVLSCGNLTARIDIRGRRRAGLGFWERWTMMMNSMGKDRL